MIIAKIGGGGLGVQMFQYASAYALSLHHKTDLKIYDQCDPSYATSYDWEYRLDAFNIPHEKIDLKYLQKMRKGKIIRELSRYLPYYRRQEISWSNIYYDENFLNYPKNVILDGVRLGWRYFSGLDQEIKDVFQYKKPLSGNNEVIPENIRRHPSASIHIRRGDYLKSPVHHHLNQNYFHKAIEYLAERIENLTFFVFSDDIKWCQENVSSNHKIIYIEENTTNDPSLDMRLMSECNHNILSNSTFSWWSAYLNKSSYPIVIAPSRWFSQENLNNKFSIHDFYPLNWIIFDPEKDTHS